MVNQESIGYKGKTPLSNSEIKKLVLCSIEVTSQVLYWIVQHSSGSENTHFLLSFPFYLPVVGLV